MIKHFLLGFLPIRILHDAAGEPFYGLGLIEDLGRRGVKLSPGTVYPVLHAMEKEGLLRTSKSVVGGKVRRYYETTPKGRRALAQSLAKVKTLAGGVLDGAPPARPAPGRRKAR